MSKRLRIRIIGVMTFMMLLFCSAAVSAYGVDYVKMNVETSNNMTHAYVYGFMNVGRHAKWSYFTDYYPVTELQPFQLIGFYDDKFYFVENGKLIALDSDNGEVKWINSDSCGAVGENCYAISSTGKVYLSGYYGPNLLVVDSNGTTLTRIRDLGYGCYWPSKLRFTTGNNLAITFDSDGSTREFDVTKYFGTFQW